MNNFWNDCIDPLKLNDNDDKKIIMFKKTIKLMKILKITLHVR